MDKRLNNNDKTGVTKVISMNKLNSMCRGLIGASLMMLAATAHAQYGGGGGTSAGGSASMGNSGSNAFKSYVDIMYSFEQSETEQPFSTQNSDGGLLGMGGSSEATRIEDPIDTAEGLQVVAGFRRKGWYGFEFGLGYTRGGDVDKQSFLFNTLIYPFESDLYLKVATGVTRYVEYPIERGEGAIPDGDDDFITVNYGLGLGYVFPFEVAEKPFGIRFEAVYLVGDRFLERESDFETDIRAPGTLKDIQLNVGLRFPL